MQFLSKLLDFILTEYILPQNLKKKGPTNYSVRRYHFDQKKFSRFYFYQIYSIVTKMYTYVYANEKNPVIKFFNKKLVLILITKF